MFRMLPLLYLIFFAVISSNAQSQKTRYQMVKSEEIALIVGSFNFERKGINCFVDQGINLSTNNSIAIEITASSNKVPHRILDSLLEQGEFDLITDELEGRLTLDVKQIIHLVKYKDVVAEISITYKIYVPENVGYIKPDKDNKEPPTQTIANDEGQEE